jgi:hypothetical protein
MMGPAVILRRCTNSSIQEASGNHNTEPQTYKTLTPSNTPCPHKGTGDRVTVA